MGARENEMGKMFRLNGDRHRSTEDALAGLRGWMRAISDWLQGGFKWLYIVLPILGFGTVMPIFCGAVKIYKRYIKS